MVLAVIWLQSSAQLCFSRGLPGVQVDLSPFHVSFCNIFKSESRPSLISFSFFQLRVQQLPREPVIVHPMHTAYPSQVPFNENWLARLSISSFVILSNHFILIMPLSCLIMNALSFSLGSCISSMLQLHREDMKVPQLYKLYISPLWRHVCCSTISVVASQKPRLLCLVCFVALYLSLQCWRQYFLGM